MYGEIEAYRGFRIGGFRDLKFLFSGRVMPV